MQQKIQHPLEEENRPTRTIDPCCIVIFGATGDLTGKRLAPALYNLGREGMLPANFTATGFARREKTHEQFREEIKQDINTFSRVKPIDETFWKNFEKQIFYHQAEFNDDEGYLSLDAFLKDLDSKFATRGNRVFYLSVQPKYFPIIIEKLKKHGLIYQPQDKDRWSRIIIEKPFGRDLESAEILQQEISKYLDESQIYRIDHYLGKGTVRKYPRISVCQLHFRIILGLETYRPRTNYCCRRYRHWYRAISTKKRDFFEIFCKTT